MNFKGWSDVGFEDPEIWTPNIDSLAKNGVILNQAYTYSTCTPYEIYLINKIKSKYKI